MDGTGAAKRPIARGGCDFMTLIIDTIKDKDLRDVAQFLHDRNEMQSEFSQARNPEAWYSHLQHRLASNPACIDDVPLGYCVRSDGQRIVGTLLIYPWRFRCGAQQLLALGTGALFVDSVARMQGFLLFRRFLSCKQASFWYAVTCNLASGMLWRKANAAPIFGTHREFLLPIQIEPLLQEFLLRKGLGPKAARLIALGSRVINPVFRPRIARARLGLVQCADWERIAHIAEDNRDPALVVCDKSVEYLRWTYELCQARVSRPRLYRFDAGRGREGWCSLSARQRGKLNQIRTLSISDWSIPTAFDFRLLLRTVASIAIEQGETDVVVVRGRAGLPFPVTESPFRPRDFPGPTGYLRAQQKLTEQLAQRTVISEADLF